MTEMDIIQQRGDAVWLRAVRLIRFLWAGNGGRS